MLPTKFRVSWPFCSGEEAKLDLQDDREGKCHGQGHHDLKNRIPVSNASYV